MKYVMNVSFSDEEQRFLEKYGCEIIPEIKLSRTDFAENEIPIRMIKYGGAYIAEITDDKSGELIWGLLSYRKGIWHFESYYDSLETMVQGI